MNEKLKLIKEREAYIMHSLVNDLAKVAFAIVAVVWTAFALYFWGPVIASGVQAMVGTYG